MKGNHHHHLVAACADKHRSVHQQIHRAAGLQSLCLTSLAATSSALQQQPLRSAILAAWNQLDQHSSGVHPAPQRTKEVVHGFQGKNNTQV
jgi:hypothetical protein